MSRSCAGSRPAAPAARHEDALSLFGEIGEQARRRVAVAGLFVHERADRNGELEIRAGLTRAIRALAVCSAVGGKLRMESVVDEGVDVRAGDDEDRSAVSAVAAAGPAARDALLAPEREASAPAISGFDVNVDFVYKQSLCWRLLNRLNADHAAVRAVVLELHAAGDLREGDIRRAREHLPVLFLDEQHLLERDLRARLRDRARHGGEAPGGHLDLMTASLDDCVHSRHPCKGDSVAPNRLACKELRGELSYFKRTRVPLTFWLLSALRKLGTSRSISSK